MPVGGEWRPTAYVEGFGFNYTAQTMKTQCDRCAFAETTTNPLSYHLCPPCEWDYGYSNHIFLSGVSAAKHWEKKDHRQEEHNIDLISS